MLKRIMAIIAVISTVSIVSVSHSYAAGNDCRCLWNCCNTTITNAKEMSIFEQASMTIQNFMKSQV